ncbi:MAG: tetratricopeptide repeat protein [Deltaproteobacteria bacterium]|nr:tetratricopeptide repeat protein [Deltaproteobacteria bacterium]
MQRRRGSSERARTRTTSLPQTPAARITYFPKRQAPKPEPDDLETREVTIAELVTDPHADEQPRRGRHDSDGLPDRDALTYNRAKIEKLLRGDRRALEGMDASSLADVAVLGHSLYEDGRLNEARVVFEGLVAMDPSEAFPYTVLGAIYLAQQDVHRALALFEAALEIDPDDVAALVYRGEIRLRLGNRPRAMKDLERALSIDPDGPQSPFSQRARAALHEARTMSRR